MSNYVLITGGSRNIGGAIAKRLSEDGLRVVVVDRIQPEHEYAEKFIEVDLADAIATENKIIEFTATHSVLRLVNNAGIVMPSAIEDTELDSIEKVVSINLTAPILCAKAVIPAMKKAGIGRIVNISSRAALGKEMRTVYSMTKAGLHGLTKTWALELGRHGITVNAVGPGPIRTSLFEEVNPPDDPRTKSIIERVPVGRLGTPDDVANAVSFFASEKSGFVTGQVLYICGGMTIGSV
ncbi:MULTISPECIES: SDR family NAD(P)-dependent oxidoreductase [Halomonas]|uniref:SDR family NAD(P)-dependent oxidoreductase n=1 Tax=Halomonas TaxID=2745 RepID=UPI000EF0249C|nr:MULTISPECIES: SDR family oxidoreductase [Halomonas]HCR98937.1 short-chain dehydrogenase [Halomonas sp.]